MTEQYAQAIWNMSQSEHADAKKIVARISAHLKETGRLKLLPQILVELKKIEARHSKAVSTVEVASEREAPEALRAAAKFGITATKATVNDSLISGWRAFGKVNGKETLVDHTSKRSLLELYHAITN